MRRTLAKAVGALGVHAATRAGPRLLPASITLQRWALRIAGRGSLEYALLQSNLGVTYEELHHRGDEGALARSIAAHASALALIPREHAARVTVMSNLGAALLERFEIEHLPADLEHARTVLFDAVAECPAPHPDRGAILSNAATALFVDPDRLEEQDVRRALALCAEASDTVDPRSSVATHVATLRGQLQHGLAELTGRRADLDLAVENLEHAVLTAAHHRGDLPHARTALARALRLRADRFGRLRDLTRAIEQIESALAETPAAFRSERHSRTASLAIALSTRFQWTGDTADLQSAISLLEELDQADRRRAGRHRANLAVCLGERADTADAHPDDLDRAVDLLRDLAGRPTDLPRDAALWAAMADALLGRAEATGSTGDLEAARAAAHRAVEATSVGSPEMGRHLSVLGEADLDRYQEYHRPEDLDAALRSFADAFAVESTTPRQRVRAALLWGHCAAAATRWADASRAHDLGRALVPQLLAPELQPRDGLRLVEDLAEAGPDALALSLFEGQPELGLVRCEQWRTLVLGQDRVRRRLWMRLLAEHPRLGERLLSASESLGAGGAPQGSSFWVDDADE